MKRTALLLAILSTVAFADEPKPVEVKENLDELAATLQFVFDIERKDREFHDFEMASESEVSSIVTACRDEGQYLNDFLEAGIEVWKKYKEIRANIEPELQKEGEAKETLLTETCRLKTHEVIETIYGRIFEASTEL